MLGACLPVAPAVRYQKPTRMTAQTEIERYVEKNFPWNFGVNLIDITLITLGLSLISRETIMPLFVSELTDSPIAIGLIPATYSLSYYLPQLFSANHAESLRRKKPFVILIGGLLERMPYLLMGLAVWGFASHAPIITLVAFYLLLASTALGNGIATPAWFTMIGKVLPVRRRGIFFGVSGGLGALMGIVGAHFVGQILDTVPYPDNYAWLFTIAFAFAALSWVGLALNREPESLVIKAQIPLTRYFRRLPNVLRHNHNYRRFLISYAISRLGAMAVGFFLVFGNTRFELSGTQVGLLTAILIGSQAVMNVVWGWVGDRVGHKIVLTASAFILTAAALVAWSLTSEVGLIVTFVLLGAAIASDNVSKFNIVLEFAVPEDQPTYIGLTNTLLAPVVGLGPILVGWLVTVLDYRPLFLISAVLAVVGGALLLLWVREPRTLLPTAIDNSL
jgi:MFS family permease